MGFIRTKAVDVSSGIAIAVFIILLPAIACVFFDLTLGSDLYSLYLPILQFTVTITMASLILVSYCVDTVVNLLFQWIDGIFDMLDLPIRFNIELDLTNDVMPAMREWILYGLGSLGGIRYNQIRTTIDPIGD